ncbi:MAG TPA: ABC-2 family transporter protein [Patescibacteria group bacterium]|jgi:ABC-type uncharacterized transport system permease subunit|nr:ABC-2 family transporter protein [Patescibacteria group bacterium]
MKNLLRNVRLAVAVFRVQAQAEKAYLGSFWSSTVSKLMYNAVFITFIDLLFRRTGNIGGYSKNDFIFLLLVSQIGWYISFYGIFKALSGLVETVRNGAFDFLLLKPVPHRSFLYASNLQPYDFLLTAMPSLLIVGSIIHWSTLELTPVSILLGALISLCGIVICNTLMFVLITPVFKAGEATDILNIFHSISSAVQMPYSKLPFFMRIMSLTLLPHLLISAAATELILRPANALWIIPPAVLAAGIAIVVFQWLWRYDLKNYTSASS